MNKIKTNVRCPVCKKYKYWDAECFSLGKQDKYIQCLNCSSILNYDVLLSKKK